VNFSVRPFSVTVRAACSDARQASAPRSPPSPSPSRPPASHRRDGARPPPGEMRHDPHLASPRCSGRALPRRILQSRHSAGGSRWPGPRGRWSRPEAAAAHHVVHRGVAGGLSGGRVPGAHPARLPANGRPQSGSGWRAPLGGHADGGAQDGKRSIAGIRSSTSRTCATALRAWMLRTPMRQS
jgi:hypothetical protein